jgi:septal ring factor EnvC (AmiA/AmiB activator)
MAATHDRERSRDALQHCRSTRQSVAAQLHQRKVAMEALLTQLGAQNPDRKKIQDELQDINASIAILCRQPGEAPIAPDSA